MEKLVVTRIWGGLGNQLFQYAAGYRIASRTGANLKLDITAFDDYKTHAFALGQLEAPIALASEHEIRNLRGGLLGTSPVTQILSRAIRKIHPPQTRLRESVRFKFDPRIDSAGANVYIEGYWQSYRYLQGIEEHLIAVARPILPLRGESIRLLQEIESTESVSVHVRRGDYITDPAARKRFATLSAAYYEQAAEAVLMRHAPAHFFVFTNDLQWAQATLSHAFPRVTFVGRSDQRPDVDDLYLMSACCHQITANSSFSWWAAWIRDHSEKGTIVITPRSWLARDVAAQPTELVPSHWQQI